MLNSNRSQAQRRGIVLVLVLAMLGLLAVVGITFATYTGQARINNRNFMQSLLLPQADELIDFGLAQLITDTNDIRSAIRGHSMARDMFGNDAIHNNLLIVQPHHRRQLFGHERFAADRHGLHLDDQYSVWRSGVRGVCVHALDHADALHRRGRRQHHRRGRPDVRDPGRQRFRRRQQCRRAPSWSISRRPIRRRRF